MNGSHVDLSIGRILRHTLAVVLAGGRGTRLRDLVEACGGLTEDARQVLLGGPMMGMSVADLTAPVVKGTTGVVVLTDAERQTGERNPCIRCGHCLESL